MLATSHPGPSARLEVFLAYLWTQRHVSGHDYGAIIRLLLDRFACNLQHVIHPEASTMDRVCSSSVWSARCYEFRFLFIPSHTPIYILPQYHIMDWLPLPRHPVRPPLELTCLTTRNYDHGDFESYPTRVGFHDRPWREWNKTFEEQADELAKLFETWLLWGCLESLIGAHIQVSDYVHVENGAHVVRLGSLMESLSIDTNIDSNQTEVMRVLKFMETLAQAFKVHDMLLPANVIFEGLGRSKLRIPTDNNLAIPLAQYLEDTEGVTDLRSKELVLWLVAFTEVMMNKITIIVQKGMQRYEHITDQSGLRALRDAFTEERWCPSDIRFMLGKLSCACCYLMSHVSRPHPQRSHLSAHTADLPSNGDSKSTRESFCTHEVCAHTQIRQDAYRTAHASNCNGSCGYLSVPIDSITTALDCDSVAVVELYEDVCGDEHLTVLPAKKIEGGYLAISHVWADGLGNLEATSLPQCQVMQLSQYTRQQSNCLHAVPPIRHFWVDTLCVPPDQVDRKDIQDRAIAKMQSTYEDATVVLVLDSWLRSQPISALDDVEICARILCSPWVRRLWTLQEGFLAKSQALVFQFEDKSYNFDRGFGRMIVSAQFSNRLSIVGSIGLRCAELRFLLRSVDDKAEKTSTSSHCAELSCHECFPRRTDLPGRSSRFRRSCNCEVGPRRPDAQVLADDISGFCRDPPLAS